MLHGLGTRRMGRVETWLAFVSSIVVRTAATAVVARPGRPGGLRRVGTAPVDHDPWTDLGCDRVDELWSDDFEVLHWVVERFERNGHSVEVGEAR